MHCVQEVGLQRDVELLAILRRMLTTYLHLVERRPGKGKRWLSAKYILPVLLLGCDSKLKLALSTFPSPRLEVHSSRLWLGALRAPTAGSVGTLGLQWPLPRSPEGGGRGDFSGKKKNISRQSIREMHESGGFSP